MSERGNHTRFDGDEFLLVIIQQNYRFETFGAVEIRPKQETLESEEKKNPKKKSLRWNFSERDPEHREQQKHRPLPCTITCSS